MNLSKNEMNLAKEQLILTNRNELSLTGITDVISFDDMSVCVKIGNSTLLIEGEGLHISKLLLENSTIMVEGRVSGIAFYEGNAVAKKWFWQKWRGQHGN